MALVGSFFTMLVVSILSVLNLSLYFNIHTPDVIFEILQTFILPCACFLSIVKGKITWLQVNYNSNIPSTIDSMVLDNCTMHVPVHLPVWWFLFNLFLWFLLYKMSDWILIGSMACKIAYHDIVWAMFLHNQNCNSIYQNYLFCFRDRFALWLLLLALHLLA